MKHRFFAFLLSTAMLASLFLTPGLAAEVSFTDTSGHWAGEAISSVVEKGLFKGTTETTFSPDTCMDRGMFVTVLGRFAEKAGCEIAGSASFQDVPQTEYYAPYVAWAADKGIVKGMDENTFAPTDPVTREQMCTLFIRLLTVLEYPLPEKGDLIFTDGGDIQEYAVEAVQLAVALSLIQGSEKNNGMVFRPQASATRAEVATVFLRLDSLEGVYSGGPDPVDPAPVDPTPVKPVPGPSGGGGGGGGGGGNTDPAPVDPTPVDPTPVDPTPAEPTAEEKAKEAEIASYLTSMLSKYDNMTYIKYTDQEVQNCAKLMTDCLRDAIKQRNKGVFLSESFVKETYKDSIAQVKAQYKGMTEDQQNEFLNVALRLDSNLSHFTTVMEYFGISI